MDSAYTREKLEQAIRDVGIQEGDIVSLQVSLGRLGLMNGVSADFNDISNEVIDSFLSVLGKEGTLLVPTYTYSIGKGEIFDVQHTPSAIGEFPEIFRKKTGAKRSRDPMLSNAAIGPKSDELLKDISKSCYGHGSTFEKMRNSNAKICMMGIGLHWATFRHHIEAMANVPFRFNKVFNGLIREDGKLSEEKWLYFAAPMGIRNCQPNGLPLEQIATKKGIIQKAFLGRGEIIVVEAQRYFELGKEELKRNPWLSAEGPPIDIKKALIEKEENLSINANS